MPAAAEGYELPLLLLRGFRRIVDDLHAELARQGHPDVRPMHGFVFQAIGPDGVSAVELGRRLGVSKQAAGKTVTTLERLGYVVREADPRDARAKVVRLTERGHDCLARSVRIFDRLRAEWAVRLGEPRLRTLEGGLRTMTAGRGLAVDVPGWFTD